MAFVIPTVCIGEADCATGKSRLEIEHRLERPVQFDFTDASLEDLFEFLSEVTHINFVIDHAALRTAKINPKQTTFSVKLFRVALKNALRLVLEQHGLGYQVREGSILITTAEKAKRRPPLDAIDQWDLDRLLDYATKHNSEIMAAKDKMRQAELELLRALDRVRHDVKLLRHELLQQRAVVARARKRLEKASFTHPLLRTIQLSDSDISRIEAELAELRADYVRQRSKQLETEAALGLGRTKPSRMLGEDSKRESSSSAKKMTVAMTKTLARLNAPVVGEFHDTPLEEVTRFFADLTGVQFVYDTAAFKQVGLDPSKMKVTLKVTNTDLLTVLLAIEDNHGPMQFVVREDGVVVTVDGKAPADGVLLREVK